MVYVLAYVPERRGEAVDMIEEPIDLNDITIELRMDWGRPSHVYLAPDMTELAFRMDGNYCGVTIPAMSGFALIVFPEIVMKKEKNKYS